MLDEDAKVLDQSSRVSLEDATTKRESLIEKTDQANENARSSIISKDELFGNDGSKESDKIEKEAPKSDTNAKTLDSIVTLKDIDLNVNKGEFVCVIGDVGSGKSSLLQAIIGDMVYVSPQQILSFGGSQGMKKELTDAKEVTDFQNQLIRGLQSDIESGQLKEAPVTIDGSIAYVQQTPWIQNKTIRDNILYGLPLDKVKYLDTIRLCELERDLEILPAGDLTEIGEKGINLSGGQKARIGLARAVYSNRDIFLMDDPISALDASVRKNIFLNVILGYLNGKTRVLVTHAIDFIHLADKIIIMEKGRIVNHGSFSDLQMDQKFLELINVNKLNNQSS